LAEPDLDKKVEEGIRFAYNLESEKAISCFNEVINKKPEHPAGHFFKAMVVWLNILTNFEDESFDDSFYAQLENVIDLCDRRLEQNENDVTALFYKGGAIGFRGRLRANRGSWINAARDGVRALPIVQRAYKLDPDNYDVLLGIGIYNYYAAVVPDRFPIVKPVMLFFPAGDRKGGLEQLAMASRQGKYARVEAAYFLMTNYYIYEKDYQKSIEVALQLNKDFPQNPVFVMYVARNYIALGNWTAGCSTFEKVITSFKSKQRGFDTYDAREAYYYLGRHYFMVGQLNEAQRSFYFSDSLSQRLDKPSEETGFHVMANLYLGMTYDLLNKRDFAVARYEKTLRMKSYEHSYREARKYLAKPYTR
jgi:hypothetical protein